MKESVRLEELRRGFDSIYLRSQDKEGYLKREIEAYSMIFDDTKLKLPVLSIDDEPLIKFDITYSSMGIFLIREFYDHFILKGADVSDLEEKEPIDFGSWIREHYDIAEESLLETNSPEYYYTLARDLHEYLKWLKCYSEAKSKYPDKYYAWYHKIRIAIGKADQFTPGAKQEISEYGKNIYKAKSGFYQAFLDFDLTKRQSFVTSLSSKDRRKWKKVIIEISKNDSDVIKYLDDFPN
jgi:hypothetical protein